jgi:hypothetical protein
VDKDNRAAPTRPATPGSAARIRPAPRPAFAKRAVRWAWLVARVATAKAPGSSARAKSTAAAARACLAAAPIKLAAADKPSAGRDSLASSHRPGTDARRVAARRARRAAAQATAERAWSASGAAPATARRACRAAVARAVRKGKLVARQVTSMTPVSCRARWVCRAPSRRWVVSVRRAARWVRRAVEPATTELAWRVLAAVAATAQWAWLAPAGRVVDWDNRAVRRVVAMPASRRACPDWLAA